MWVTGLPEGGGAAAFAWRALALSLLCAAAVALLWRQRGRAVLGLVVVLGVVFRIGAWTWPPDLSSDLYRYAWDGRVQLSGRSPYAAPPGDESLSELRDDAIWPHINRKEAVTVYPPGGQVVFLALAAVGLDSVKGLKAAALASELVALWLVVLLARRRGVPEGRVAIYAWCPLLISEVCVSGHLDAVVLPLMLGGLLLAERDRPVRAGLLLGAATCMKLYPVLLLAALPRRGRWRAAAAMVGLGAVLYAGYAAVSGGAVLGFLPDYVRSGEDFNLGVRGFLQDALAPWLPGARTVAMLACAAALAGVVGWLGLRREADRPDVLATARSVAVAFVLLLPTAVHPWYAVWTVPLLCIRPSAGGLWLAALLPLSYLKYGAPGGEMPAWVTMTIWLPAIGLTVAELVRHRSPGPSAAPAPDGG